MITLQLRLISLRLKKRINSALKPFSCSTKGFDYWSFYHYCVHSNSIKRSPATFFSRPSGLKSRGGGGFFHSKGTWGCAAREGILFRTSSLAKGVLFGNFSRVRSRQGYAFWEFWSKRCQNSVTFVKKTQLLKNFGLENAKIWQVLPRKCQFRALLKEKLV